MMPEHDKTVVCFGAHPDDIEFSCTGTVSELLAQGYRCIYVIITNGESGFKAGRAPAAERVRIRKEEQAAAARMLGVSQVIFLDERDGFLESTKTLRRRLADIIKRFKPEIIFSFDPANRRFDSVARFHPDHRAAAEAVFDACFAAKNDWIYPGEPHRVRTIYFYGSDDPNTFVDITGFIDRKMELLACHRSQFLDLDVLEQFIREELSGPREGFRHAEAFRVLDVRQVT